MRKLEKAGKGIATEGNPPGAELMVEASKGSWRKTGLHNGGKFPQLHQIISPSSFLASSDGISNVQGMHKLSESLFYFSSFRFVNKITC